MKHGHKHETRIRHKKDNEAWQILKMQDTWTWWYNYVCVYLYAYQNQ